MSETKFTPGPWTIVNGCDIFGPLGGDSGDGCKCDYNDGWMIAEVGIYESFVGGCATELGSEPRRANMSLIAAAPKLYEALKYAEEVLRDVAKTSGLTHSDAESCADQALEALMAAIGETK